MCRSKLIARNLVLPLLFLLLLGQGSLAYPAAVPAANLAQLIQEKGHPGIVPSPDLVERYRALGLSPPEVADWPAPLPEKAVTGTRDIFVIRVDFADRAGTQSYNHYVSLFFGTSQGQMRHYFTEVSYGSLMVAGGVTANWVRSAHNMTWWGEDGSSTGDDQKNAFVFNLAREAIVLADPFINFAPYDKNGNGVIDPDELSICIIHAGNGQESTGVATDIWSHRWYIFGDGYQSWDGTQYVQFQDTFVDGKRISKHPTDEVGGYFIVAENSPLGTVAHEFGHDIGLPDLYDTDYSSDGVGNWCLMSSGSWLGSPSGSSPSHPSAWCKAKLGWISPTTLLINSGDSIPVTKSLKQIETDKSMYKLAITSTEYLLIENRQNTGYDSSLPGPGMLIWYVDDTKTDNKNEKDRWVDLEEAHGGRQDLDFYGSNQGDSNDTFCAPQRRAFNDTTDPNSRDKAGGSTGINVINISASGTTMTFALALPASYLARVRALTLNTGEDMLYCAVNDTANGFAYFGTGTRPGKVVKVKLSDLSRVGALTLNTGENELRSAVIDAASGFAYFGVNYEAKVVKIRLSDFTRVGTLNFPIGESPLSAVIDPAAGFAYFATFTNLASNSKIVKISLSNFTRVGSLTLGPDVTWICSAVIDVAKGFAYFGTNTSPGKVAKVRLSDFTCVGVLTLNPDEEYLGSAVIDTANGFAYFATGRNPGKIVKVKLSDLSRVGALTLNLGDLGLFSGVIDVAQGFAYFATYAHTPGRIVKIKLSDFTYAGAISLNTGENDFKSGVIDTVNSYAYFGTYDWPGKIVKVSVGGSAKGNAAPAGGAANKITSGGSALKYLYPATATVGGTKLFGVGYADPVDIYAAAGALQGAGGVGYGQAWDTDASKVDSATGRPRLDFGPSGSCIVMTGGPAVHNSIKYYMDQAPAGADQSLAFFRASTAGGVAYYQFMLRAGGVVIASVPATEVTGLMRDLCLIQCFTDSGGRIIFIITGLTLKGTQAGALWFVKNVMANPSAYLGGVYVIAWNDSSTPWTIGRVTVPAGNNDGFVDYGVDGFAGIYPLAPG